MVHFGICMDLQNMHFLWEFASAVIVHNGKPNTFRWGTFFSLKTTAAVLWPETTRPGRRFLLVGCGRRASKTMSAGGSQFLNMLGFCEGNLFKNTPEFHF